MTNFFGRRLNYWAVMAALFLAAVVNSVGAFMDWWPGSFLSALPMLALGFGAGWLFGKPVRGSSS